MINSVNLNFFEYFSLQLGQSSIIEYLIEHGADVPQNLSDWEQVVIGCALRGKFT